MSSAPWETNALGQRTIAQMTPAELDSLIQQRVTPQNLQGLIQQALADATVPAGNVEFTARADAPTGYLLCDGSAVSRTTYSNLFAAISTTYGVGDGLSTFNVPDLRGRVPVGLGTHADVNALGDSDAVAVGSRTPNHTHAFSATSGNDTDGGAFADSVIGAHDRTVALNPHTHPVSGTTGTGAAPYVTLNGIIKT